MDNNMINADEILNRIESDLAQLRSQLTKPQPEKGVWWYFENDGTKWIAKCREVKNDTFYASEHYCESNYEGENGNCDDWYPLNHPVSRPATTDEITHFMDLHRKRLGIKDGVTVDRSGMNFDQEIVKLGNGSLKYAEGYLWFGDYVIRDSSGNWAKVVESKVVVGGKIVEYGKNGCRIAGRWYDEDQINDLCKLFPDHEGLKTIWEGFKP